MKHPKVVPIMGSFAVEEKDLFPVPRRPRHRTIIDFDPELVATSRAHETISVTQPGLSKTIPEIIARYSQGSPLPISFNPAEYSEHDLSQYDNLSKTDMAQMAKLHKQRVETLTSDLSQQKSDIAKKRAEQNFEAAVAKRLAEQKDNPLKPNENG